MAFWKTEFLFGTRRSDDISGTHRNDFIFAGRGDDVIEAGAGNDRVFAGAGDDTIRTGSGRDTVFGGRGFDTVVYQGSIDGFDISTRGFFGTRTVVQAKDGSSVDRLFGVEALRFEADDYTLFLNGRNNAVLAGDDAIEVGEDDVRSITAAELLANDRDFDGDALSIASVAATSAAGAQVAFADGVVTYDPGDLFAALGEGERATDTFTYTVTDGRGGETTATVTVTITGANDAPELSVTPAVEVDENTAGTILTASATDAEGDTITFSLEGTDVARFSIDAATGAVSFAEAPDFETPADADGDNVYEITVVADDGQGGRDAEDLAITVRDVTEIEPRINEIHYDNAGTDVGEFVEVRVGAGEDVSTLVLEFVNGNGGGVYESVSLADITPTSDGTYDYYVATVSGIQNGSPDGVALADGDDLIEFLSYEGVLTATEGVANGEISTDIGVFEASSTAAGTSLQRNEDGSWAPSAPETPGKENGVVAPVEARINEIHYDNAGADVGEFVEVRVEAGADVSGLELTLYNGSNGTSYATVALAGLTATSDDDYDYYVIEPSSIQNGAPDGLALSDASGLIEFLSYEGTFTAVEGPAEGTESTDIGVAEPSSTAVGTSLQRLEDGTWSPSAPETRGQDNASDGGGTGGGDPTPLTISEIQGTQAASTRVGELVTVTAIVVGDFQNGDGDEARNLGGFFLQEELADQDGNLATSEGIFVFDPQTLADVSLGDRVSVTGTVAEAFGKTQIVADAITVGEAGAVADVSALAQSVTLDDENGVIGSNGDYTADLEAYESMLVTFTDTLVVNEMFQLGRFSEVKLTVDERPLQFTQFAEPDAAAFDAYLQDVASDRIVFDDGLSVQNAPVFPEADLNGDGVFNTTDGFNMGDSITGATGVLDFAFGEYRLRTAVDGANTFDDTGEREDTPPDVGGTLTVGSFNVLNFFTTLDGDGNPGSGPNGLEPRGADSQAEFDRQLDKLTTTIIELDADVLGLVELENEFGGDRNGDGQFAIETLVNSINTRLGEDAYTFVDPGRAFVDTGDAISVGMIFKPSSVSVEFGSVAILDDGVARDLGFADQVDDGQGIFDGPSTNRAPLAATFIDNATGEDFTVAVTHMKSKGGNGEGDNADQGDGAGAFNALRTEGVEVLTAWLDEVGDTDDGERGDILVLGDLNAYAQEDPIDAMIADGYSNLEAQFDADSTTFVFDGFAGTLDYAFASGGLAGNVTGAEAWEINSAEPTLIDYNLDFGRDPAIFDGSVPYRTSDHDPLLVGLDFGNDVVVG